MAVPSLDHAFPVMLTQSQPGAWVMQAGVPPCWQRASQGVGVVPPQQL